MSVEARRTRTIDLEADKYDHEIQLVDTTALGYEDSPELTNDGSWRDLARRPTRTSVKEQLSRRKYASWSKNKLDGNDGTTSKANESDTEAAERSKPAVAEAHPENEESQAIDFGKRPDTADPDKKTMQEGQSPKRKKKKPEHEVDVLYENQRGAFLCGIPLYSHSSLLNFDPAAWVTKDFRNSPVNITNAQVPDPSWMWAWKTWYVDMSYDVDEEGWQYSFIFGNNFAWHGTHPWFHSFVRRRRWLRKRVKRTGSMNQRDGESGLEAAHHLNPDYFTIHSKARDQSPGSTTNPEAQLARPAAHASFESIETATTETEKVGDIPSLLRAIRVAMIDREKVDAVKLFLTDSGDELYYLADSIPEIMSQLVFQNSKRQILQSLKDQAVAAQQHRDEHDAEDRPEGAEEKRRIDNLLKAADAANKEIQGLEYWSDRKHVLQTEDEPSGKEEVIGQYGSPRDVVGEIKGISEKAETSKEIRVDRRLVDKGKKPERQHPQHEDTPSEQPHLGHDQVLVPTEDDKT